VTTGAKPAAKRGYCVTREPQEPKGNWCQGPTGLRELQVTQGLQEATEPKGITGDHGSPQEPKANLVPKGPTGAKGVYR